MGHQLLHSNPRHLNVYAFLFKVERHYHCDLIDEEPIHEFFNLLAHTTVCLELPTLIPIIQVRLEHKLTYFR